MLGHQFGQNLVLSLDLFLQVGDPVLVGGVVRPRLLLERRHAVLEELLLPAVEDGGLQAEFIAELRDRLLPPANAASGWRPSLPACNASAAFSCVLSFTLLGERILHFELNRNISIKVL